MQFPGKRPTKEALLQALADNDHDIRRVGSHFGRGDDVVRAWMVEDDIPSTEPPHGPNSLRKPGADESGAWIVEMRQTLGLTQAELGRYLGTHPQQICYYERGHRHPTDIRLALLTALAEATQRFPADVVWPRDKKLRTEALWFHVLGLVLTEEERTGAARSPSHMLPLRQRGLAVEVLPAGAVPSASQLQELLAKHGGNVSAVGRALGRDRSQVHRWLERHGISRS